jgi:hypothetical protein
LGFFLRISITYNIYINFFGIESNFWSLNLLRNVSSEPWSGFLMEVGSKSERWYYGAPFSIYSPKYTSSHNLARPWFQPPPYILKQGSHTKKGGCTSCMYIPTWTLMPFYTTLCLQIFLSMKNVFMFSERSKAVGTTW